MQKTQNRLTGLQKITFGATASVRYRIANGVLLSAVLSGLAFQLGYASFLLALAVTLTCVVGGGHFSLARRHRFEIDFAHSIYYIETGLWSATRGTGGPLSDISQISITKDLQFSEIAYATLIEFHPQAKRAPYRLDLLRCPVPVGDFGDRVALYLELAARLQVPVCDDSGWNGWRPPVSEPRPIVIPPGGTHPALQQTPRAKEKW
ncbi:MAG: hypothetical protein H7Z41_01995 [Cytophagales bacterium]|nr:hypothetical protein [Armatimonadota bacterium]